MEDSSKSCVLKWLSYSDTVLIKNLQATIYAHSRLFNSFCPFSVDPRVKINDQDDNGMTALYAACYYGHQEVVQTLLDESGIKVDVQASNVDGFSPLHIAAQEGIHNIFIMHGLF